ncbi:MAG TPA: MarR family winged helix-turn-helix transcriptional regulator [Alloacidobacterium sp.]|nr:MarR family winged helix-turn-helix transcriptional regulator [Alloacidobacterium sp.]
MPEVKQLSSRAKPVTDDQALALDRGVAAMLRRFKLEPSVAAGSPYADLHANDVGLLVVLAEAGEWSVRKLAQSVGAPISTISSALDRLESRGLVGRRRRGGDRRIVHIELLAPGLRLVARIRANQIETCRAMLAGLSPQDREELIRLVALMAYS